MFPSGFQEYVLKLAGQPEQTTAAVDDSDACTPPAPDCAELPVAFLTRPEAGSLPVPRFQKAVDGPPELLDDSDDDDVSMNSENFVDFFDMIEKLQAEAEADAEEDAEMFKPLNLSWRLFGSDDEALPIVQPKPDVSVRPAHIDGKGSKGKSESEDQGRKDQGKAKRRKTKGVKSGN